MTSLVVDQDVNTVEGIEEVVSLLMAAEPYINLRKSPEQYLTEKVEEASDNLSTREIAERILSGNENFSFIMNVSPLSEKTPNGKERYAWKTNYEPHSNSLDKIRRYANVMHEKISVALADHDNYAHIESIAIMLKNDKDLYDSWEEIVKLKKKEIKAAEPADLAHAFYGLAQRGLKNIEDDGNQEVVRRALGALMYLEGRQPKVKAIASYLSKLAERYQKLLPNGTEFKTLHDQLGKF